MFVPLGLAQGLQLEKVRVDFAGVDRSQQREVV